MDKTLHYLPECFRNGKYALLILLSSLLLTSCTDEQDEVRILFAGDILLSRNVRSEYNSRETFPWEFLQPLFDSSDLLFGNLEGAVGEAGDSAVSNSGSPVFDIAQKDISLLKKAGFDALSTENNHSGDLGIGGKQNTVKALLKHKIQPLQFESSPQFFTVKGVTVSVVAINLVPGRDSVSAGIPSIEVSQKLRLAENLSDIVIVFVHWGSELLEWPSREQRRTAEWMVSAGADIIIGSHPHVIQEPEMVNGKPVFFSLGNHLFDQKYARTKEGLIVDIRIKNGEFTCSAIGTRTAVNSFYPELSDHSGYSLGPVAYQKAEFHSGEYQLKAVSMFRDGRHKVVLHGLRGNEKVWESHPLSLVSIASAKLDGKADYLFLLEKHYSPLDKEINVRPYVYSLDKQGLLAKWRGSALAWPLLDAKIAEFDRRILCALHRGDSFIRPDKKRKNHRVAAYRWNGFGFTGIEDSAVEEKCRKCLE